MKKFKKLIYASIFFGLFSMSLLAVNPFCGVPEKTALSEIPTGYKSLIGTWDYTVEDVPYEYSSGVLFITKEKEGYKVQVKVNHEVLTALDVKVNENKLDFSVFIESGKVMVSLEVNDDVIKGKANSPEGTFSLSGKRSKS